MKAEITSIRFLNPELIELFITIRSIVNIDFFPGQYVRATLPPFGKFNEPTIRYYSICSFKEDVKNNRTDLGFLIELNGFGAGSQYFAQAKQGDYFQVDSPAGNFLDQVITHDPEHLHTQLLISAGTGIAPFIPLMYEYREGFFENPTTTLIAVNFPAGLMMGHVVQEIKRFKAHAVSSLNECKEKIDQWFEKKDDKIYRIFIAGGPGFLSLLHEYLLEKKVPDHLIHFDTFI